MKKLVTLYINELKVGIRGLDMVIFGIGMPLGILILIASIAGDKMTGNGYTYLDSAFSSLIAVGICASAFMGVPLTIADYRDKKILKHFFCTPCSPFLLLVTVVLYGVTCSIISAIIVAFASKVMFGYHMIGSVFGFIGAWFLTLISMFSIGMMLASLCRTVKSANLVTSLVYFPMLFLSGTTIPFELFPKGLQKVASVLPLTQGIKLMKQVSMGESIDHIIGRVFLLIVISLICVIVSIKTFRWE